MPPLASNNNTVSDSEDEDYVPPVHEQESDSDESSNEREAVVTEPLKLVEGDSEEKKRKRDALWAEFQSSVSNPKPLPEETQPAPTQMVKVEKKYRFAGDEVVEVVEVPEDSPEAKKWPLWENRNSNSNVVSQHAPTSDARDSVETQTPNESATSRADSTTTGTSQNQSDSSSSVVQKPGLGKRPGPRKPKTTLAPFPTSGKPKKITTLDKSAMDWRAHIDSEQEMGSSLKEELEAHRKTGGYLERVEFLQRVEERKEETLDVMKSSKRRKL